MNVHKLFTVLPFLLYSAFRNINGEVPAITSVPPDGYVAPHISNWSSASTVTVLESAPASTTLCDADVVAMDNSALVYNVIVDPISETGFFYFDKRCTCLKTNSTLNYERQQKYLITIRIRDEWSISPAYTCTVSVADDNDAPVFTQNVYPVSIYEETLVTFDPLLTCTDEDIETFTYSLMAMNNSNWFNIDRNTGEITVNSPVDRDTFGLNQLYLTVHAVDIRGATGSTQVLITVKDINDNRPLFVENSYEFSTTQFTVLGSSVGLIVATDRDQGTNAQITYSCGTNSDYHSLSNGSITTSTNLSSISYGTTTQLTCYATDHGTPALTSTTHVNITKTEAPTTTTSTSNTSTTPPTTTTTTEASIWERTEFIVIFSILMALLCLLLLCLCYFCMRLYMTGYGGSEPRENFLGHQNDSRQFYQPNQVRHSDYAHEDKSVRNPDGVVIENQLSSRTGSRNQMPGAASVYSTNIADQ